MKTTTANVSAPCGVRNVLHVLVLASVVCFAFFASASPAMAASRLDFTLYNETGGTIENVYCTSGSDSSWGIDILGTSYLYNGYHLGIVFQDNYDTTIDLKLVDTDGQSHIFNDVPSTTFNNLYVKKNSNGNWYYTTSS